MYMYVYSHTLTWGYLNKPQGPLGLAHPPQEVGTLLHETGKDNGDNQETHKSFSNDMTHHSLTLFLLLHSWGWLIAITPLLRIHNRRRLEEKDNKLGRRREEGSNQSRHTCCTWPAPCLYTASSKKMVNEKLIKKMSDVLYCTCTVCSGDSLHSPPGVGYQDTSLAQHNH